MARDDPHILIAGGGIAGLALGLTLHQIGVACTIFEAARRIEPLGVGINLQPNAVRELMALGIGERTLGRIGIEAREWALVGLNGREIHAEPRGRDAGYLWPQFAVHRGRFHMALHAAFTSRAGADAYRTGARATGYRSGPGGATLRLETRTGPQEVTGTLIVAADGIHSALRAQMLPDQPPIHWTGALMWRGVTRARPVRTGASFVGLGTGRHRMVLYPISGPDADGCAEINWIAERTVDPAGGWQQSGWFRPVEIDRFANHFEAFRYDWLDVPALLAGARIAYENPMIDRDPAPCWIEDRVALMGDAAHAMVPTGSNGASQAVIDARVLGAAILAHGVTPAALEAYDAALCDTVGALVLRNRESGPFGLLDLVDARCGGVFEDIDQVVPPQERAAFLRDYRSAAGFDRDTLNAAPPIIPEGARLGPVTPIPDRHPPD